MAKTRRQREERRQRVSARRRVEEHQSGFSSTVFNRPDGFKLFQVKEECVRRIDVMPYVVGQGNPFADPGQLHYERTIFTHARIGTNENTYICPAKTCGKPCPICEHRAKLVREGEQNNDLLKDLLSKERQLFVLKDVEDPESFYIWDVSYHLFGKLLDNRIKTADDDDDYEYFADLEEGLTLRVAFEEKTIGKGKPFYAVSSIDFKKRRAPYDEELLESIPCLDDLLIIESYDSLEKIYYQESSDDNDNDDDDDDEPKKRKTKPVVNDDDDDDPPFGDDDDEPVPPPKAVKRKPAKPVVDDDDDDDDESVPPPKAKAKAADVDECVACGGKGVNSKGRPCLICNKNAKPKTKPVVNDDDDDDPPFGDDDDEPAPKPAKKKPVKPVVNDDDDDDPPFGDDDEEPAPPKKGKPAAKKKQDDDDDEEWDEDWDD